MERSQDTILDQVRKLMTMAEHSRSNPEEAANAAAKAARLMRRHNITEDQVRRATQAAKQPYHKTFLGRMDSRWNAQLAATLAEHNFCDVVLTRGKDPTRPDIQLIGQPDNAQVVEYLYTYLLREIRRLAKAAFLADSLGLTEGKFNRAFGVGAVRAIDDRLDSEQEAQEREENSAGEAQQVQALVLVKDADLKAAVTEYFPKLKTSSKAPGVSDVAWERGYAEGQRIPMNKALGS